MRVRCASCGWTVTADDGTFTVSTSRLGSEHLRDCPKRDDLIYAPWWTFIDWDGTRFHTYEVGWHPLSINDPYLTRVGYWESPPSTYRLREPQWEMPVRRYRFTAMCDRDVIGYPGDTTTETTTQSRWDLQLTGDDEHQAELLADGWEPFSAFLNVGYIVAFRRRRP